MPTPEYQDPRPEFEPADLPTEPQVVPDDYTSRLLPGLDEDQNKENADHEEENGKPTDSDAGSSSE